MISVVLKISRHRGTPRCIWNWFATHLWISAECTSATFTHLQTVIRRVSISFFQILTFASRRFLCFLIVHTVSTHLKAQVSHIMSFLFIIYKIKFHNIMVTLTPCLFYHLAAGSYNQKLFAHRKSNTLLHDSPKKSNKKINGSNALLLVSWCTQNMAKQWPSKSLAEKLVTFVSITHTQHFLYKVTDFQRFLPYLISSGMSKCINLKPPVVVKTIKAGCVECTMFSVHKQSLETRRPQQATLSDCLTL